MMYDENYIISITGKFHAMRIFLIVILANFVLSKGYCQEDTTRTIELENLVIKGNRISTPFNESSRNINIITKKNISRLPIHSIPEALMYVPGVDIRQRGPMGVQSDIGIRGGTFEQTLILINGIKLTDPQTGHHSLNVPVNLGNISQIEILKGPGARIYGQNAFSGAVNFITSIPEKRYAGIHLLGGQNGLFGGRLDVALPGKFGNFISISRDVSDGYRHNTDFKINNAFYQSSINLYDGKFEILGGISDRKFGANGFYASPDFTEQYEEVTTSVLSIGYRRKINNLLITPRIYWRGNRDNYFFVRSQPEIYENLHITHVGAVELNSSWLNALGQTGLGVEFRHESINGDWVRNGEQTKSNLNGFSRKSVGVFMEHQFKISKFDITPGVYINYYSDFDLNFFPGIDVGYSISKDFRLYGNIGKSYRIPTFYDMYYQSPVEQGNPGLRPEDALSYELGLRYINRYINLEINWFYQDASELIDWVAIPVTDTTFIWSASNFSNINRVGIEIAGQLNMENILRNNFLRSMMISYNFIDSDLQEKEITSRYVLENLRHQVNFGVDHMIAWQIYHHFKVRFNQREDETSYWVLDSKLYWDSQMGHTVFLEVTNLADTHYKEIMTPMPGRWFRAGIAYQFDF